MMDAALTTTAPRVDATLERWRGVLTTMLASWPVGSKISAAEALVTVGAYKQGRPVNPLFITRLDNIMLGLNWTRNEKDASALTCIDLRIVYTKEGSK